MKEDKKVCAYSTAGKRCKFDSVLKDLGAWILLLPSIIGIAALIIRPQILGVVWSFFGMKGFKLTEFVGFDNYKTVLTDSVFLKALINTFKYVFWSFVIGFPIPFIIAVIMNELLHARSLTRVLVYIPGIMPTVACSVLWTLVFYPDASGLLNTILSKFGMAPYVWLEDSKNTILYIIISMTWQGMGGTAIYYFAIIQGVSRELYEAALIDGAGFFRRIKEVTIPHMYGVLLLFAIRQCISVFSITEQPLQMTGGGPNNASVSLGLLSFRYAFKDYKPQYALALGIIQFIILFMFTVIYYKVDKRLDENNM